MRRTAVPWLALPVVAACISPVEIGGPGNGGVQLPDNGLRVLFVGNSLTTTNDLPGMVQTIAEAAGHELSQADISAPNFSLEDHYNSAAPGVIRQTRPDVVVLQEGPSSLPENQVYLKDWTIRMNESIQEVGARAALFMVWPEVARKATAFPAVRDSYSNAALAVGGVFIPAGESWRELWKADSSAALYGSDGYHPSELGSIVAALTIFRMLFDEPVTALPSRLVPVTKYLPVIELDSAQATVIYQAVESAVSQWGRR